MDAKFSFAQALIRQAGALIKSQMATEFAIEVKSDHRDLVTEIDKASQAFLVEEITKHYPQDNFLAEEENLHADLSTGSVWVIDPIDGTVNFIAQQTDFAVILAYVENGVGQFGLIYDVMADQLYSGGGAFPVTCNGQPLPLVEPKPLEQSLVACNTGFYASNTSGLADLFNQSLGIRNYGCAGISMAKVLSGQLWGYASRLCPWDFLAASIMGEALGYEVSSLTMAAPDNQNRQPIIIYPKAYRDLVREALGQ